MFAYEIRDEKRRKLLETCYHEAGHAVMAFLLRLDVAEICVSAQGTHLGTTTAEIPDGPTFKAANSLSGYVAESWAWGLKSGID
ncbi:MAG: hypothetical protein IKQ82_07910, partial [Lentisphaeria bacterium]|nr:hypothetical protein [Lentisphaeria bacterium]